jgi:hypothetical protein
MPKSLHEAVFERSEEDSVSVNTVLVNAVTAYVYQSQVQTCVNQLAEIASNMSDLYDQARIRHHLGRNKEVGPIDNQDDSYSNDPHEFGLASNQ